MHLKSVKSSSLFYLTFFLFFILFSPASFVDGLVPLDKEASDLLSDTFEVLSSKEIKLSTMRSKPGEEVQPDDDEIAMATAVMQVAQKKLISQVGVWNSVTV